jgi:hypothetical protein
LLRGLGLEVSGERDFGRQDNLGHRFGGYGLGLVPKAPTEQEAEGDDNRGAGGDYLRGRHGVQKAALKGRLPPKLAVGI